MTKARVTTADRLSNIIEVVELGRRSGLLTVERGSSQTIEQGEVYFTMGRATYAAVEGLRGREALSVLAGWGQCRFAFEPNIEPRVANITAPQPTPSAHARPPSPSQGSGSFSPQPAPPRSAPSSYHWDAPAARPPSDPRMTLGSLANGQTDPHVGPHSGQTTPNVAAATNGASWPSNRGANAPSVAPTSTGQLSWPFPSSSQPGAPAPAQAPGQGSGSGPLTREALERRPRRSPDVRDLMAVVNAYNLSRNHRTILLLADGEHTVLDIARLSSKQVDEIAALLNDLERRGLVYYY